MTQPSLRVAWPLPLEALVVGAAARVGLTRHELAPLAPWIARAAAAGPSPALGPFAHELRLPNRAAPLVLGLAVFADVSRSGRALTPLLVEAERWSAHILGPGAAAAVGALPARTRGVGWRGGASWEDGRWSLRLHGAGSAPDVAAAARSLGADLGHLELEAALAGVDVDITAAGVERVRTGERTELGPDAPRGAAALRLGRTGGDLPGRTVATSFKPGITASAVTGHDVDAEWLRGLVASLADAGFALHAAALELELGDDGARATSLSVSVASAPAG